MKKYKVSSQLKGSDDWTYQESFYNLEDAFEFGDRFMDQNDEVGHIMVEPEVDDE